jgi:3',5'-cyclic-AMP phosphodiesterase
MKREMVMKQKNEVETAQEANEPKVGGDGIDRRNFLQCMAWAGTGLVWSMVAGVPTSKVLADTTYSGKKKMVEDFSFVQISDSHIGFNKDANNNVIGTLQEAINRM